MKLLNSRNVGADFKFIHSLQNGNIQICRVDFSPVSDFGDQITQQLLNNYSVMPKMSVTQCTIGQTKEIHYGMVEYMRSCHAVEISKYISNLLNSCISKIHILCS